MPRIPTPEKAARPSDRNPVARPIRVGPERLSGESDLFIALPLRCLCGLPYPTDVHLELCAKARNG